MRLHGRVALVTGSAQGIGEQIVRSLAKEGATVVLNDINLEKAIAIGNELRNSQIQAQAIRADVSSPREVERMIKEIKRSYGKIDILVNNAGIQTHELVINMSQEQWKRTLAVNLGGVFNCCRAVGRLMISRRYGRIINISSISAKRGSIGHAHYCASKAGIEGFSRALALELSPYNITVNVVAPGIVETAMAQNLFKKKREKWLKEIPLRRLGNPSDVAQAVLFLASPEAGWITGITLEVNGGMHLSYLTKDEEEYI